MSYTQVPRPRTLAEARETYHRLITADFSRNPYPVQRATLSIWRAGNVLHEVPGLRATLLRKAVRALDMVWTNGVMGAELPREVCPGPGLRLGHGGRGVILHPTTRIGARVVLYHQITIGVNDDRDAALIEDRAYLGAGCKVLGPVVLGEGSRIGANAVVTKDTEPDCSYVGIPATRVGMPKRVDVD